MKNSVLDFEREQIGNYSVVDYRSLDFTHLRKLINNKSYLKYVNLKFNDLIENISYNVYQDDRYWDLLLIMNDRDALFDMPYEFDIIVDMVNEITEEYFNTDYQGTVSQEFINWYKENKKEKLSEENDKAILLLILKDEILTEVIRSIKYGL